MVTVDDVYMYATDGGSGTWDDKGLTLHAGVHMEVNYEDLGSLRLKVDAMRVVLTYASEFYRRPIGYVDVPDLKIDPGDQVLLDLPMVFEFRTDDF